MASKKSSPKHLALWTIHFPITAIVSILHRLSGVALVFLTWPCLWLSNEFMHGTGLLIESHSIMIKVILSLTGVSFIYHAIAGFRHLLMDVGIGMRFQIAQKVAWLTLIASLTLSVLLLRWIW